MTNMYKRLRKQIPSTKRFLVMFKLGRVSIGSTGKTIEEATINAAERCKRKGFKPSTSKGFYIKELS